MKILRAITLISLKEAYLFFRNLYGLVFHPFKTSTKILAKPDWSQTILIFGLPGYLWILTLFFFVFIFFFFRNHYDARIILLLLFYLVTLGFFLLGCYFFFWLFKALRKTHTDD